MNLKAHEIKHIIQVTYLYLNLKVITLGNFMEFKLEYN